MAKIKSYTDLNQSKKLAEILPLESADMWWLYVTSQGKHIAMMYEEPDPHYLARMESYGIKDAAIRCWSLTALLNVLPNGTDVVKEEADTENERYMCTVLIKDYLITTFANNPVDACVDAVIKLHNLKML